MENKKPRGIRNNNAGNIRKGDNWLGLDKQNQDSDKEYCIFISPEFGIRALAKLLLNYQKIHKLNTVESIISRYAPNSENNTHAYISHVSKYLNIHYTDEIDLSDKSILINLIKAIIKHENGFQPYSDELIKKGIGIAVTI